MLGIISMITFLFLFIAQLMILIIVVGNDKTDFEQNLEDEEQIKYLNEYKNNKKERNIGGSYMKKELYTWEQVKAYSVIALHNLMTSANEITLKDFKMVIEPLKTIHKKDVVEKISQQLIDIENKA